MRDPVPKENPDVFSPFAYPIRSKKILSQHFLSSHAKFEEVLLKRRSKRIFTNEISNIELSTLLHTVHRIEDLSLNHSGFWASKRTVPSAGARHPIDLLVSLRDQNNNRTLSLYNPIDHSLNELALKFEHLSRFFDKINENLHIDKGTVIWFCIQTEKTSTKYLNPESLYWKDCGAILYCIQLVSTYLNLNCCPLGTLANKQFHSLFGDDRLLSGGGILVGK